LLFETVSESTSMDSNHVGVFTIPSLDLAVNPCGFGGILRRNFVRFAKLRVNAIRVMEIKTQEIPS